MHIKTPKMFTYGEIVSFKYPPRPPPKHIYYNKLDFFLVLSDTNFTKN